MNAPVAQLEREVPVVLEERLMHFLQWLEDVHGVVLHGPNKEIYMTDSGARELVEEYVNT